MSFHQRDKSILLLADMNSKASLVVVALVSAPLVKERRIFVLCIFFQQRRVKSFSEYGLKF
jgi:hypothetical protein